MGNMSSFDLFTDTPERPGSLGCRVEIAATMAEEIRLAAERGINREIIAASMSFHLGEKIGVATLNGYTAPSHTGGAADRGEPPRDISLVRAMAFDAAIGVDVLLQLFARKRGDLRVVTAEEAAYIELGRINQEEKSLAERKRALQMILRNGGKV